MLRKNKLLDLNYVKKKNLLESIYHSSNHTIHQVDLIKKLSITASTLVSTVDSIRADFQQFKCADKIAIIHNPTHHTYYLEIAYDFSLNHLINYYIQNSIKFKLAVKLLHNEFSTFSKMADQLYISYSSLRREFDGLKKFLSQEGMTIQTRNGIRLKDNELSIRVFYTILFWEVYDNESWPFDFLSFSAAEKLITYFPNYTFDATLTTKKYLAHYFLAISILRIRKNSLNKVNTIADPIFEDDLKNTQYRQLTNNFSKHVPYLPNGKLHTEIATIYSVIVTLDVGKIETMLSNFYCIYPQLKQINFLEQLSLFYEALSNTYLKKLSSYEEKEVFSHLLVIHYRTLFYTSTQLDQIENWLQLPKYYSPLYAIQKRIIHQFFDEVIDDTTADFIVRNREYLELQYCHLTKDLLALDNFMPKINLVFISKFSNTHLKRYFSGFVSSFANVTIKDSFDEDTDVIISDFTLPANENGIKKQTSIIYVDSSPTSEDYRTISNFLVDFCHQKSCPLSSNGTLPIPE